MRPVWTTQQDSVERRKEEGVNGNYLKGRDFLFLWRFSGNIMYPLGYAIGKGRVPPGSYNTNELALFTLHIKAPLRKAVAS